MPVCTDCHRAHDTTDPRDGALAMRTPEICGRCHTDEKLMTRYGLSTKVVDTYLADFHGMAATLAARARRRGLASGSPRSAPTATACTTSRSPPTRRPRSCPRTSRRPAPSATRAPGASFPKAWLSHYEPTPQKAPIVWGVMLFYKLMIPFMVGGLVLQIALHLWRVVVNR